MKIPHQFTTLSAKLSAVAAMSVMVVSMGATAATAATAAPASADSVGGTVGTADLPPSVASGYQLTFHDEFDGDKLDMSKWGYQYGCFDTAQRSQATYTDSPDNVFVHDGYLNLTARYSPTKTKWDGTQIPRTCKNGNTTYDAPFTSGMITTKKSDGAVLYAAPSSGFYVEARIKLPSARSSWSSFWTTGSKKELGEWPGIGESDIFESKGYDPDYLMSNTHSPQAGNPKKSEQHQGMMHGDTATSQSQFHTYGMLKTADSIEFYFDGQMTHRVKMSDIKGPNPFVDPDNNYILKLNQMVGGNYLARPNPKSTNVNDWSDKTYVDATKFADDYKGIGPDGAVGTDFAGSTMYVDYVRVYEPKTQEDKPDQPAEPEQPTPTQPEQPAQPQPESPAPTPAPETPAQPENPVTPAPAQPAQPEQPAPAKPEQPSPAPEQPKPQPSAPVAPVTPAPTRSAQPADQVQPTQPAPEQAQPAPAQTAQPSQPSQPQPTKPIKPIKKPSTNRLASTGMFSWYRPIITAWNNFCDWVMSWF